LAQTRQQAQHKQSETSQENQQLLLQLRQVQAELERSYQEAQRLKKQIPPPKPPGPFGAADRIKKQLGYRLGAVMVDRHDTLGGWLAMPWALIAEARAFRKERRTSGNVKLPPIHTYRDASEAERVQQQLSYRLGNAFIKHAKSPIGWLSMPFTLRREVREFRRTRKAALR
jgi:hypothetical protein